MKPLGYILICCLIFSVVTATIYLDQISHIEEKHKIENNIEEEIVRGYKPLDFYFVGNDPGAGKYGWLNLSVVILDHFDYTTNLTNNASCFCYTTVNNTHAGTQEMDGVAFEVACQYRLNATFKNETGAWKNDWIKGYANCPILSVDGYECDMYNVTANDNYLWGYAVADNSGAGYTLNDAQNITQFWYNWSGYLP